MKRPPFLLPTALAALLLLVGCSGWRAGLGQAIAGPTVERVAGGVLYRLCKPATGNEDLLVLWAARHGVECDGGTVSIEVPRRFRESWLEASSLAVGESFWAALEPAAGRSVPAPGRAALGLAAPPDGAGAYRALAVSRRPGALDRRARRVR